MSSLNDKYQHGIRDNHGRGKVADFLTAKISSGSVLSVVSAYFTIYAYEALANKLDQIETLRFLFGEPRFVASLDPEKTDKKSFKIEDEGLELANRLQQKEIARRCSAWIREKVEIRSIRQANLLHGKVFENLLASYNPDTRKTARKQSGSFYTPREVVDFMVDEALIQYFNEKLDDADAGTRAPRRTYGRCGPQQRKTSHFRPWSRCRSWPLLTPKPNGCLARQKGRKSL